MQIPGGSYRFRVEWVFWTLGGALALCYAGTQLWSQQARRHGIALLREAGAPSITSGPKMPEGLLSVPRVQLEVPIYAGATEVNLHRGAAHIAGTSGLEQGGNIGIAGHRDGFFRKLKDVRLDDEIELVTGTHRQRYRVVEIQVVAPWRRDVLAPTRVPSITLVTCYPFYFLGNAPERYIVRAERSDDS